MKLIVGLGNPGEKYNETRHNAGFIVIDELSNKIGSNDWKIDMRFNANISQINLGSEKIILTKPQTFMNNSGIAVKSIADYYKISSEDILVIHDDIDLELGEIKIQKNRGSAGHNGVQSVIDNLKTKNFIRIRIGIKKINIEEKIETEKFVLQKFTEDEKIILRKTIKKAADLITAAL